MADEEIFFMRVDEPLEVRKQLLESARASVQTLERVEQFKRIRTQKAEIISKLRAKIKDLNQLFIKLRELLPDTAPAASPKELGKQQRKDSRMPVRELHAAHPSADREVAKLHHQLKAIEHKLNSLT